MKMKQVLTALMVAVSIISLQAQVNLSNGLVAYYPFNGNPLDYSGNYNNGIPAGSAALTTDQWGNANSAYNFSGTSSAGSITVPNSPSLQFTTACTFSFWLKLNSVTGTNGTGNTVAGGDHCVFAKDGDAGGGLWFNTSLSASPGNMNNRIGNVSMTTCSYTQAGVSTGQWQHFVYIMDATEQRMYINGVLVQTTPGAPNFATMNTKNLMLARYGSNWYPMNGALDEFRVYNRAINASEIATLSANGVVSASVTNISPTTLCAGQQLTVDISSTGPVQTGNTYTVQISDANGVFTNQVNIGSLVSNAATATITCTVPEAMPSGSGYKLRVLTNAPVSTGAASTATFTVNGVLGDIPSAASFRFIGNTGGRNYFISTVQQNWNTGRTTCSTNGGILGYVADAATNNLLAANASTGTYMGYTDQVTEGTWVWEGGYPTVFTKWSAGEPNNSGNEDFAATGVTGFWNDVSAAPNYYLFYQLNAASSNSPVCSGNSVTLLGATVSGATYQWNGPNGFTSSQQNPVITNATLADAGTYTLTITNGGCSAAVTTVVSVVQGPNGTGQTLSLASSLSTGLVLYYPMNANANDASGNGLNGTMIGGVTAVADRFGNPGSALQLNGTNGFIDAPDGVYFNGGDFTVSCWIKANNYPSWARAFDFGNGAANNNVLLAISQGTNGRPQAEIYNGTVSGGAAVSGTTTVGTNVWTFLTYSFSAGTGRLYVNGTQVAQATQTAPQNVLRTLCYIGRSNWAGDSYMNGAIDEFRIYNRLLTAQEIQNLLMEQPDAMNLVAVPASVCPNTASNIKVIGTQKGVTYQLQNAATSANIGAAQAGNCDTLSFSTGNLTVNTNFQVVATGPNGCSVIIGPVSVTVVVLPALPVTTGASRCEPGSVTLSASGAPVGGTYNWYAASSGGSPFFTGPVYSTPTLSTTTTYYVSILFNGCETGRTAVTATINLATAPAVDLYTGLIAHWMLDGNTADSSGRGNNALIQWNGAYVADRLGNAAHAFQPVVNAFLDAGNPGDFQALTTQVTLSLWIYETNPNYGTFSPLMNKWQNNGLYMGLDNYYDVGQQQQMNRVRWRVNGATYVNSSTNVPYNTWHHIVCTYNGSRLKIYQNGVQTGDLAYTGVITNTITNFQIGRQANGFGNAIFEGIYDDGRVYNRALNQDEVLALYNNEMVAFSNSPVCEGNILQLSSPVIAGATYAWTGPNGFTSNQAIPSPILNAAAANAGVYTLIISNPNGCVTSPQTNTVVVNPLPTGASVINDTVCGSGNAVLTASGTPPGGSYQWYSVPTGGTPIVGQTGATYTISNLTATDTFYVVLVSAAGCTSPTRTPVIAVYNNPMSQAMAVSGATICDDATSSTVTLSTSQTGVSYQAFWSSTAVSAATGGTGSALNLSVNTSGMGAGTHVITVIASQAGCGNVTVTDTARINVIALPNATITPSGSTTFCSGGSVTLSVAMSASYLWSNGATTQTILVTTSGTYSVAITNASGCVSNSGPVTVNVIAPPVATLSASGPLTFCAGDNVTLTAGGGGTYLWSTGATSSAITVSTSGNYYCIVSNGSCTDTTSTMAVTVNPAPTANINASGPTTFCAGDNVTLFANASNGYLWSTGATTSSINVTTGGSYYVITTGANGCTAQSAPVTVVVNATPSASITASGPTTICQGDAVTLTAGGGSNYLWSTGATTSAINVSTGGNYYCIVSNGTCSDTTTTIAVTVNPAPTANITASGPLSFCAGDNVTLTADASDSYLWSTGAITQSIVVTTSGTYSVTTSAANGCTASSSPVTITVNPTPNASITASGSTTICQGDVVTLTAGGGSSYLWSNGATSAAINVGTAGSYNCIVSNGTCSDTTTTNVVTVNPAPTASISASGPTTFCTGDDVTLTAAAANSYLWSNGATTSSILVSASGNYFCTVTGANGCTAVSNSIAVSVVPPPIASISAAGPTTFCQGGNVTLNASGGSSYLWSTGAITSSINVTQSGNYSVQVSNGSCGVNSTTITVVVNPLPNVQFSMGNDTSFCVFSNPLTLTGGSPAGGTYSGPGIIGNTFYPGAAGTGYVTLTYDYTDGNGCYNSANAIVFVDLCMSVDGVTQQNGILAYPNPSADFTTVRWTADADVHTLEVFDATGKLVYAENAEGKTSTQLDMHDWADGIYSVRLTGNDVQTIRVIRGQ